MFQGDSKDFEDVTGGGSWVQKALAGVAIVLFFRHLKVFQEFR